MKRNKLFVAINIFGLSIGLACCQLILLYVINDLNYDRFHQDVDRMYRITCTMTNEGDNEGDNYEVSELGCVQRGVGDALKNDLPEVEGYIRMESNENGVFQIGEEVFFEDVLSVDPDFFQFFSFPLISGNPSEVLNKPGSVIITEEKALKYFGATDVVGRSINLLARGVITPLTITAVAENVPQNSSLQFGIVVPVSLYDQLYRNGTGDLEFDWVNLSYTTIIRLRKDIDASVVGDKLNGIIEKYGFEKMEKVQKSLGIHNTYSYHLQAFKKIHLDEEVVSPGFVNMSSPIYSFILAVVTGLILLIALVNYINLSLAQSVKRFTEVGIRKVLGSSKQQLFTRFVGESLMLCLVAFLVAFLLVYFTLPYFNAVIGKDLQLSYLLNSYLIFGFVAIFLISTLAAGSYPSIILSRLQPSSVLSGRPKILSHQFFTKSLVTLQFSLSIFLIIGTIVLQAQFSFLLEKELGYNDENLIELDLPFQNKDFASLFRNKLEKNPAILSVSGGKIRNNEGGGAFAVKYNGKQEIVLNAYVDENFLPTTNIQLLKGENFQSEEQGGGDGIIVNEAFLKEFNIENPLETIVTFVWEESAKEGFGKRRIRGVVRDFHFGSLHNEIAPYMLQNSINPGRLYVRIMPGQISQAISDIEEVYRKLIPDHPFQYQFMDDINAMQYEKEARWKQIISYSSIFALFISCIGLFGLSRLTAEQKAKEISIRRVNGGKVSEILAMLNIDFLKWVLLAFFISCPLAWFAVDRWLQSFAYRTELSWWIFALAGISTLLVALLTVSWQSWWAATRNPVEALRNE